LAETGRYDQNPKEGKQEAPPSPPPQQKAASSQPQVRKLNLRNSPGKDNLLLPADRTAANKTWLDNSEQRRQQDECDCEG
jgi:hypothetical protein